MRRFTLVLIAAVGLATAAVPAVKAHRAAQENCCGDPICWPCFLGLK